MNHKRFGFRLERLIFTGMFCVATGLSADTIRTGFDAGESVTEIDGYPGTAGEGWTGGWKIAPPGTPAQIAVTAGRPLDDSSGTYLKMSLEPESPDLLATAIYREVAIGSLDTTRPYEVRFAMRPDFPTVSDLDMCFATASSTAGNPGTGPTCTWMIKTSKSGWVWGNGDGNGGATWVKSGMECRPEQVYHFVVTVDPAASKWKVAVTSGSDRVESEELGFRQANAEGGRFLYFGTALSDAGVKGGFSVDSLSIATP